MMTTENDRHRQRVANWQRARNAARELLQANGCLELPTAPTVKKTTRVNRRARPIDNEMRKVFESACEDCAAKWRVNPDALTTPRSWRASEFTAARHDLINTLWRRTDWTAKIIATLMNLDTSSVGAVVRRNNKS